LIDITYRKIATSVDGDAAVAVDAATYLLPLLLCIDFYSGLLLVCVKPTLL
jgi:hypothetical protein